MAHRLDVSEDTVLRELNQLIELQIVTKTGKGKAVIYKPKV